MILNDLPEMLVVSVHNSNPALLQKHGFTGKIMLKVPVLIWSDMVRLYIGKNTVIKHKAWVL